GTAFDFFVGRGFTGVLLYHGAVVFCNNAGDCETLTRVCQLGQFDSSAAQLVGHTDTVSGADRDRLKAMFRYAQSQRPLLRDFRINDAERCLNRPTGGGGARSLVDVGPGEDFQPPLPDEEEPP